MTALQNMGATEMLPPVDEATAEICSQIDRRSFGTAIARKIGLIDVGPTPEPTDALDTLGSSQADEISPSPSERVELQNSAFSEVIDRREFGRRSIKTAKIVGATTLVVQYGAMAEAISRRVNQIGAYENKIWPKDKPSFTLLNGAEYAGQEEITIYLPGFGDMHSIDEAVLWKETSDMSKDQLTGAVDYSNEGASIPEIAEVISENIDLSRVKVVNFVCRSIGGLYVIPIAAELGIPVGSVLFMSSPSRLSYGDFGNFGALVAHAPKSRGLAMMVKFGFNTWLSARKHGIDIGENLAEGWQSATSGASGVALRNELVTAAPINIHNKKLLQKARKVFLKDFTKAAYTASNVPATDGTVMVVPSSKEFRQVFKKLDIDLGLFPLPYDGHADVKATATHMKQWSQVKEASVAKVLASK